METVDEKPSKVSKFAPENDAISRMPDNVITNILNRLPIQEAVRTDILARKWRYKWTMLTQLVFDRKFFEYLIGPDANKVRNGRSLSRLLLHFKGIITKFVLYIPNHYMVDAEDANHWVLLVSRKGLQELDLVNMNEKPLKLPSQLFTCMELKHLKLDSCAFRFLPSFLGFPNLLSLDLEQVKFGSTVCGNFIAQCPLLEILKIIDYEHTGEVKFDAIAKLANLRVLSLSMCVLDSTIPITRSGIIQLMCLLPKLQELDLDFWKCKFIAEAPEASVDEKFPNAFLCLRDLKLSQVDFSCDNFISFVIEIICSSPNLQTLEIMATYKDHFTAYTRSSLDFDCNKMGQFQLQNVVIDHSKGSANEAHLMKYILACSPLLKKIVIKPHTCRSNNQIFWLASKLLKFHRVSPVAEIDLNGIF